MASSLRVLKRLSDIPDVDLSNLILYFAGEKASAVVVEKTKVLLEPQKLNPRNVGVGYGSAENTLCATCTPPGGAKIVEVAIDEKGKVGFSAEGKNDLVRIVSIGTSGLGHEVTIRNESGTILPDLQLGEINVEGPCVTPGYFNNEELTKKMFPDRLLKTGDLGFSYDGEFYYYARKDDLIIVGGRNVVPDDVELVVESRAFVRPACSALLALDNPKTGALELNLLVEVDLSKSDKSLDDAKKELQVAVFKAFEVVLNKIIFVEKGTVEKTSSGKKRRKVIKKRLLANEVRMMKVDHESI